MTRHNINSCDHIRDQSWESSHSKHGPIRQTNSFNKFTPGKCYFNNITKSEHPVLFGLDSGLCAIAHALQKLEFCIQRRCSMTECLLLSTSLTAEFRMCQPRKISTATCPSLAPDNTGLQDQRNSKETSKHETPTPHFCWINLPHFQSPWRLKLNAFSFGKSIYTEFLSDQSGYIHYLQVPRLFVRLDVLLSYFLYSH